MSTITKICRVIIGLLIYAVVLAVIGFPVWVLFAVAVNAIVNAIVVFALLLAFFIGLVLTVALALRRYDWIADDAPPGFDTPSGFVGDNINQPRPGTTAEGEVRSADLEDLDEAA